MDPPVEDEIAGERLLFAVHGHCETHVAFVDVNEGDSTLSRAVERDDERCSPVVRAGKHGVGFPRADVAGVGASPGVEVVERISER